ncbi:VOC family protein [Nocardia asteroides]|uniref:VOC family protein n=1 Tax=Nocardia asteroides TaxID=1824 RepID=UPI001E519D54|nr:VOC family protein [Nocardia asteroides]UGT63393.1 VOC family protein [Nocardia asteroides]
MAISQSFVNICSDRLSTTRDFYVDLLGFHVSFDSDWFVQLSAEDSGAIIGIMARDHELVPEQARGAASGSYLTIVVDDVETVFARAKELSVPIVEEPKDLFYGQRRMLVVDPNGVLVDVSSPTAPPPTGLG